MYPLFSLYPVCKLAIQPPFGVLFPASQQQVCLLLMVCHSSMITLPSVLCIAQQPPPRGRMCGNSVRVSSWLHLHCTAPRRCNLLQCKAMLDRMAHSSGNDDSIQSPRQDDSQILSARCCTHSCQLLNLCHMFMPAHAHTPRRPQTSAAATSPLPQCHGKYIPSIQLSSAPQNKPCSIQHSDVKRRWCTASPCHGAPVKM